MSETPIFTMPEYQGRLTDSEIENRVTEAEKRGDFNLWEEEMVDPSLFETPEVNHQAVQPPAFEMQTLSHEQQLQHSIENMDHLELLHDVAGVTRNVIAMRRSALNS